MRDLERMEGPGFTDSQGGDGRESYTTSFAALRIDNAIE
jgi:hypothetical protein